MHIYYPDITANWSNHKKRGRDGTWYWRIWWWIGYHGLYQINWDWKNWLYEIRNYKGI